jgi:hypothetical protein
MIDVSHYPMIPFEHAIHCFVVPSLSRDKGKADPSAPARWFIIFSRIFVNNFENDFVNKIILTV